MTDTDKYASTFTLIDVNNDGLISADELRQVTKALGNEITGEAATAAIQKVDADGDGLISLEEFAEYMAGEGIEPSA